MKACIDRQLVFSEQLQQAVVWPSYSQPSSHLLLPPLPPPPLQLLSSASSDYLSTSTTLHQHTQTHSTRLVALTTDTKRKIPLPIPATTLIKIETDATTLDQTKTLQAVSTIGNNTGTVYTDQNMTPLVTTHVIYQHPTNLILSQPPTTETPCRSQATSPVACLTPPPDNLSIHEEETLGVQDASNQTDIPICSEDDNTIHTLPEVVADLKSKFAEEEPTLDVPVKELTTPAVVKPVEIQKPVEMIEPAVAEVPKVVTETVPETAGEPEYPSDPAKPDLSGLELLSNSIVEFENCRKSSEESVKLASRPSEQGDEVLTRIAHMTLKDANGESESANVQKVDDNLGGLDLLCALAAQRIMEEVDEKSKSPTTVRKEKAKDTERSQRKKKNANPKGIPMNLATKRASPVTNIVDFATKRRNVYDRR